MTDSSGTKIPRDPSNDYITITFLHCQYLSLCHYKMKERAVHAKKMEKLNGV